MVTHGGGLPGWGSWIVMLPDYGVAIVALANLTYKGPATPARQALAAMLASGGLTARATRPAPALLAARAGANRLLSSWDDVSITPLLADNFLLEVGGALESQAREAPRCARRMPSRRRHRRGERPPWKMEDGL
jgi:serine-type D-Ala-D-Ala carboxypeptidase/endopeptidase